jgi:hypothetical protein
MILAVQETFLILIANLVSPLATEELMGPTLEPSTLFFLWLPVILLSWFGQQTAPRLNSEQLPPARLL